MAKKTEIWKTRAVTEVRRGQAHIKDYTVQEGEESAICEFFPKETLGFYQWLLQNACVSCVVFRALEGHSSFKEIWDPDKGRSRLN